MPHSRRPPDGTCRKLSSFQSSPKATCPRTSAFLQWRCTRSLMQRSQIIVGFVKRQRSISVLARECLYFKAQWAFIMWLHLLALGSVFVLCYFFIQAPLQVWGMQWLGREIELRTLTRRTRFAHCHSMAPKLLNRLQLQVDKHVLDALAHLIEHHKYFFLYIFLCFEGYVESLVFGTGTMSSADIKKNCIADMTTKIYG